MIKRTVSETGSNRMAKMKDPVSPTFDLQTAKNFRDLAGLGYADTTSANEQILEIKKRSRKNYTKISSLFKILFLEQKWTHIVTKTYGNELDNYSFTIIKNLKYKKFVFSFSGTKTTGQLYKQYIKRDALPYKSGKEYIKIMKYFLELYQNIKADLKMFYEREKDPAITQYIFVGHSLGGAMASVAIFDFMQENIIPRTENSPILMTYGQPRTGNYAFANELMKLVPIVFRFYNNYDIVESVPACYVQNGRCKSEFGKIELDKNFNGYLQIYNNLSEAEKNKFYPFHIGGNIFTKSDTDTLDCSSKSEVASNDPCKGEINLNADFHTHYFGYQISEITNPKKFPYGRIMPKFKFNKQVFKHQAKKTLSWKDLAAKGWMDRNDFRDKLAIKLLVNSGLSHTKKKKK
jgi:hypothetical protein